MIKMIAAKCPECGASLEVDGSRKQVFCTYCGTKIILNNENETVTRHIDEAEVKRTEMEKELELKKLELEEERRKYERAQEEKNAPFRKLLILIWIIATVALVVTGLLMKRTGSDDGYLLILLAMTVGLFGGVYFGTTH